MERKGSGGEVAGGVKTRGEEKEGSDETGSDGGRVRKERKGRGGERKEGEG